MQDSVAVKFYVCSWERAQGQARAERICEHWLSDWLALDRDWLIPNNAGEALSPLASAYYAASQSALESRSNELYLACEQGRFVSLPSSSNGLALRIATRLPGTKSNHSTIRPEILSKLAVPFQTDGTNEPACPPLRLELFSQPVGFDAVFYRAGNQNYAWQWQTQSETSLPPLFALYERRMHFEGGEPSYLAGQLQLVMQQVAELRVQFATRPIPSRAQARVDNEQALDYSVSTGNGYVNIAAALEIRHLESGQRITQSLHGGLLHPAQLPATGEWPSEWREMNMDAEGIIRHGQLAFNFPLYAQHPAELGLPQQGTYQLRVVLLAIGYRTAEHTVRSQALGGISDNRLSRDLLSASYWPALVTYTPGATPGLIPAFEFEYSRCVLSECLEFEVACDMPNLTCIRFALKLVNKASFALGVIVQAGGWQGWLTLAPNSPRYLGGAVSVSGLSNWRASPLHPASRFYGWNRQWVGSYLRMTPELGCTIEFSLFITASAQPESIPAALPEAQAVQHWHANPDELTLELQPWWGAIKRFTAEAQYDYSGNLSANTPAVGALYRREALISQPPTSTLDGASYFYSGYATPLLPEISPWHKNPWPNFAPWGEQNAPLMCSGERRVWDGQAFVWQPAEQIEVSLSRALRQGIAVTLGIADAVIIDGRDLNWIYPGPDNELGNELWLARFYTLDNELIDDAAMRAAFQSTLDNNATLWPQLRNLQVHSAVRFGLFMDGGSVEPGQYYLSERGHFEDRSDLEVSAISTRFLYRIKPEFR